ncbi:SAF domain-containing protein [Arthrobacter sp. LAPM80]|uniref:Flp pilus assembly protein CpaB n=1 Tax=Arthrobacter sp. LAPM80 TaxID=3141788 RepID=UPI00398AA680
MKTRLLGGAVALVLAIMGALLLSTYVKGADSRAQAGMNPAKVLVVQQPVAAGTTIEQLKSLVKEVSLPKSAVVDGAVTDLETLDGKVVSVALVPGEQLLSSRLAAPQSLQDPNQVAVPKGLEELTLKLAPERVLGGKLKAGDTVGVFISYNAGVAPRTGEVPATKLQFHKVLVTRIGSDTADSSAGATAPAQPPSPTGTTFVTLAQSGADAVATVHAIEFGTIYLSKENADASTADVPALHKDGVFK